MKKISCSLLSVMLFVLMASCDNPSTSNSNSVSSNEDVEKNYVEYKTQDGIHTLKTSKDDSTYVLEKNNEVIHEGSYLKISDNSVVLTITEEDISKNFMTTIDEEGKFKSSILEYASLDKKDITSTYDMDYGFGNSTYVIDYAIIDTYDYVNLYKNGIYEQITKESVTNDKILSVTYGTYTLENDALSLENSKYVINDNFAWEIFNLEGHTSNPELLKQCKTSYTLFDNPQSVKINNEEVKILKVIFGPLSKKIVSILLILIAIKKIQFV